MLNDSDWKIVSLISLIENCYFQKILGEEQSSSEMTAIPEIDPDLLTNIIFFKPGRVHLYCRTYYPAAVFLFMFTDTDYENQ